MFKTRKKIKSLELENERLKKKCEGLGADIIKIMADIRELQEIVVNICDHDFEEEPEWGDWEGVFVKKEYHRCKKCGYLHPTGQIKRYPHPYA